MNRVEWAIMWVHYLNASPMNKVGRLYVIGYRKKKLGKVIRVKNIGNVGTYEQTYQHISLPDTKIEDRSNCKKTKIKYVLIMWRFWALMKNITGISIARWVFLWKIYLQFYYCVIVRFQCLELFVCPKIQSKFRRGKRCGVAYGTDIDLVNLWIHNICKHG